ncbi:MAG: hypothetical protein QOF98_2219, partial [Streptomyces sp.]|nr:hypothetical protein [Streptomyces sp.]
MTVSDIRDTRDFRDARDARGFRDNNVVPPTARVLRRSGFTIAADGSYAACLAEAESPAAAGGGAGASGECGAPVRAESPADPAGWGTSSGFSGVGGPVRAVAPAVTSADREGRWFVERWTLSGPEPYAVGLAGSQPEEPGTQVLPLADGRVLIRRRVADRHDLALLYPTGPSTGELPVGSLPGTEVRLLPPAPLPDTAFALAYEEGVTTIWQVHGPGTTDSGPVRVMTVRGRCTGGVWLDRAGRLLALDRELDGRTKAVAVDLHTAETSPLLQLTEDSDDRLLLAEPDSGLLVLRSDATGEARLGWGVLGSRHPVRFPDALRVPGALLTPLTAQPGQILSPESTVVALRAEVPGGAESLALWRPGERRLHWRATPRGWLGPTALWLPHTGLRLPYAIPDWPCGLIPYDTPVPDLAPPAPEGSDGVPVDGGTAADAAAESAGTQSAPAAGTEAPSDVAGTTEEGAAAADTAPAPDRTTTAAAVAAAAAETETSSPVKAPAAKSTKSSTRRRVGPGAPTPRGKKAAT